MRSALLATALPLMLAKQAGAQAAQIELDCPPALDSTRIAIDSQRPASVFGEVTNRDTGRPLSAGWVVVRPVNRYAATDSVGSFRFDGLADGRYTVELLEVGFARRLDTLDVNARFGVHLHISLQPQYPDRCPTVQIRKPNNRGPSRQLPNER